MCGTNQVFPPGYLRGLLCGTVETLAPRMLEIGNCSKAEEGNMIEGTLLWKTLESIVLTERGNNSLSLRLSIPGECSC